MQRLIFALVLCATPASADELAEARQQFLDGTAKVRDARWSEALTAFEASAKLRPHAVTSFNVAACERALGRYTRARVALDRALEQATPEVPLPPEAKILDEELQRLLVRAEVRLSPADAALAVDGRPLEVADAHAAPPVLRAGTLPAGLGAVPPAERFALLIDPGAHVLTLSRQGWKDVVLSRTFAPGDRPVLVVQLDRLPAKLRVASSRPGAVVTVQGVDVGVAPVEIERPPGSYKVLVQKPGCATYAAEVLLRAGMQVDLSARLEPQKIPVYKRWWFWTAGAAVLAGVGVAAYFIARPTPEPPAYQGGSLGWVVGANSAR